MIVSKAYLMTLRDFNVELLLYDWSSVFGTNKEVLLPFNIYELLDCFSTQGEHDITNSLTQNGCFFQGNPWGNRGGVTGVLIKYSPLQLIHCFDLAVNRHYDNICDVTFPRYPCLSDHHYVLSCLVADKPDPISNIVNCRRLKTLTIT